ncbi:MAG: hypothetical protein AAF598_10135, partial [Bacteroidota bacterium]
MKIKRLLSFLGIFTVVGMSGILTLIFSPGLAFSKSYDYGQCTIHSKRVVDQAAFNLAIDEAMQRLADSELYDPEYHFDLLLADGHFYNTFDNALFGNWAVARAIDNNVILKKAVNEQAGTVANGSNEFELAYVLAHEMVHCLQAYRFGKKTFNPFSPPPLWKLEGYPEYIARSPDRAHSDYHLAKEITVFLERTTPDQAPHEIIQIGPKSSTPFGYYKALLLTSYLIEIEGMSYAQILEETVEEASAYANMM